jgi:hypothetical protein
MAIRFFGGYTKGGKSRFCSHLIGNFEKAVIFDKAHCFEGDIYEDPDKKTFRRIFDKYMMKTSFRIVIRPGRLSNKEELCDDTIKLASALGRMMGKGAPEDECLQLVIDEADSVCSSNYQSPKMKFIVNEGRHDNVDTNVIARNPNRIHTDIRANVTEIYCFRLAIATRVDFIVDNYSRENAQRILTLKKFWHLKWKEEGFVGLYDENYKLVRDFSGVTDDIPEIEPAFKATKRIRGRK